MAFLFLASFGQLVLALRSGETVRKRKPLAVSENLDLKGNAGRIEMISKTLLLRMHLYHV